MKADESSSGQTLWFKSLLQSNKGADGNFVYDISRITKNCLLAKKYLFAFDDANKISKANNEYRRFTEAYNCA